MEALDKAWHSNRKLELTKAVSAALPPLFGAHEPALLPQLAEDIVARCAQIGVIDEPVVLRFCRLVEVWGPAFPHGPKTLWAARIYRTPRSEGILTIAALETASAQKQAKGKAHAV